MLFDGVSFWKPYFAEKCQASFESRQIVCYECRAKFWATAVRHVQYGSNVGQLYSSIPSLMDLTLYGGWHGLGLILWPMVDNRSILTHAAFDYQRFVPSPYPAQIYIDKYVTIAVLVIGFPGNVMSFIIWMRKRMRHSSGFYLAVIAVNDIVLLVMAQILDVYMVWEKTILNVPIVCETFAVLYMTVQPFSPCLVLAFTTERYISICHPFRSDEYCTLHRAKIVVTSLAFFCLVLASPNAYFFTLKYDKTSNTSFCNIRDAVLVGGSLSVYIIYSKYFADGLTFFLVPIVILVLNILVIREMKQLARFEPSQLQTSAGQRKGSTTVMLLAVSFYQIFTLLPVSVAYALEVRFQYRPDIYGVELATLRYKKYQFVLTIIKEYGISYYAFNFIIYLATGQMFRQELRRLVLQPVSEAASRLSTEQVAIRTSGNDATKRVWRF